jgi:transcriptional regulator with XRE-family HTH domain
VLGVHELTDDAAARRKLGRALRKARDAAGLTQAAVADKLGCVQGKINKIETTNVRIRPADLERLIALYLLDGEKANELRALAAHGGQSRRQPAMTQAFGWLSDLEMSAAKIFRWHAERIPGPLQSEPYLLRQFHNVTDPDLDVAEVIRQRTARARIFTMENPPSYNVVLSESALRRMPGGRYELIIDQVRHLLELMHRCPQLRLHILPFDADIDFVPTDFTILCFDGDERDFAYVEYLGGSQRLKTKKDIAVCTERWQRLRDAALNREESIHFMANLAKESQELWRAKRNEKPSGVYNGQLNG